MPDKHAVPGPSDLLTIPEAAAILRLKADQQQVIVLRFVERFDHSEVAAALGKSESYVRVIQHRALIELRRLLTHEVKS